jgi:hypothetical protein
MKLSKKLQSLLIVDEFIASPNTNKKLLEVVLLEGNLELLEAFKVYDEQTIMATIRDATLSFKDQMNRFTEPQPINSKNLLKVIQEVKSNEQS